MFESAKPRDTALILHPVFKADLKLKNESRASRRDLDDTLEEAEGLARAIDLDVVETLTLNISKIHPGYLITKGLRENVKTLADSCEPTLIIVNHALSPIQQRNLERDWGCKVIDRTGLILEIFGARAQTREGRIQVELAALEYQRSRLVRSWTHLERQRGGAGFMGGPGETQIELDKRMIGDKIKQLKKELSSVARTRDLARQNRAALPCPVVSIVGYTNAGKSTLFNRLTDAGVYAEDLPFATLDPTLRRFTLPDSGHEIILSDTVGFISDLPTHLVAAFSATLEQTVHGDVLVHLIDASRPDYEEQRKDVITILKDLGIEYDSDQRIIEVYNKVDLLDEDGQGEFIGKSKSSHSCMISAADGLGIEDLLHAIEGVLTRDHRVLTFQIPVFDGKAIAWLYDHGDIVARNDEQSNIVMEVKLSKADIGKFTAHFGYQDIKGTEGNDET